MQRAFDLDQASVANAAYVEPGIVKAWRLSDIEPPLDFAEVMRALGIICGSTLRSIVVRIIWAPVLALVLFVGVGVQVRADEIALIGAVCMRAASRIGHRQRKISPSRFTGSRRP